MLCHALYASHFSPLCSLFLSRCICRSAYHMLTVLDLYVLRFFKALILCIMRSGYELNLIMQSQVDSALRVSKFGVLFRFVAMVTARVKGKLHRSGESFRCSISYSYVPHALDICVPRDHSLLMPSTYVPRYLHMSTYVADTSSLRVLPCCEPPHVLDICSPHINSPLTPSTYVLRSCESPHMSLAHVPRCGKSPHMSSAPVLQCWEPPHMYPTCLHICLCR